MSPFLGLICSATYVRDREKIEYNNVDQAKRMKRSLCKKIAQSDILAVAGQYKKVSEILEGRCYACIP